MDSKEFRNKVRRIYAALFAFFGLLLLVSGVLVYAVLNPSFLKFDNTDYVETEIINNGIENGIHTETGFIYDEGMQTVITSCTSCHSAKLVTQNRATKEGWIGIIRWMQDTQNLWDLGENEAVIVNYLAKNYAPEARGRRHNLQAIEWYDLVE